MKFGHIRNFSIIAHIDHGKSTLADRMLELTGTITKREQKDQVLDSMDLERERGITIKAHPIRMMVQRPDGGEYILNMLDTPGHVDFSYEVSRSLAACEGVILLVDASQGVEAQTLANYYLARDNHLVIIPVINKIDLPNADLESVLFQMEEFFHFREEDIIMVSAKTGKNVDKIIDAVIERIPPPEGELDAPLKALIFDSTFDPYRGVITYIRVIDGRIATGAKIKMFATGQLYGADEIGTFKLKLQKGSGLDAGEVGYVIANIKEAKETRIGDTLTGALDPCTEAIPGFKESKPMVFYGLYPIQNNDYDELKSAIEKLIPPSPTSRKPPWPSVSASAAASSACSTWT